jgi:hypothetical protein
MVCSGCGQEHPWLSHVPDIWATSAEPAVADEFRRRTDASTFSPAVEPCVTPIVAEPVLHAHSGLQAQPIDRKNTLARIDISRLVRGLQRASDARGVWRVRVAGEEASGLCTRLLDATEAEQCHDADVGPFLLQVAVCEALFSAHDQLERALRIAL